MFESDDFDQVLSQFDFPDVLSKNTKPVQNNVTVQDKIEAPNTSVSHNQVTTNGLLEADVERNSTNKLEADFQIKTIDTDCNSVVNKKSENLSPKHTKRKIINTFFDHQSKRKFPGPAGLLTGNIVENNDETVCQMELLSQDMEFSQNYLRRDLFESPLWIRLLDDIKSWNLHDIDSIKSIKQQALAGNLRRRKAQIVIAFIETVDRSVTDPLIILRDTTGNIKCTLHRDAWSTFSPYIVSEYCALVLSKPTVLTTGSAFKKHYLNITLSNIYAIYSSAVLKDEEKPLPESYVRISEEDITVIKSEIHTPNSDLSCSVTDDTNKLLDGLDSFFADDLF